MNRFVFVAALTLVVPVMAVPVVYTDQVAFLSALSGPYSLEDFESYSPGSYGTSTVFGDLTFDMPAPTNISEISILDTPNIWGPDNTTPGGSQYLFARASGSGGNLMEMSTLSPGTLVAWGAYFTDVDTGNTFDFFVDGVELLNLPTGPNANALFVGFIADPGTTFDVISLVTNTDPRYGIDDVITATATAPVPEPATISLLSLGLLGLAARKRKRA